MTVKHRIQKGIIFDRTNMAYKCKVFKAFNLTFHGHQYFVYVHMCVQFQMILV